MELVAWSARPQHAEEWSHSMTPNRACHNGLRVGGTQYAMSGHAWCASGSRLGCHPPEQCARTQTHGSSKVLEAASLGMARGRMVVAEDGVSSRPPVQCGPPQARLHRLLLHPHWKQWTLQGWAGECWHPASWPQVAAPLPPHPHRWLCRQSPVSTKQWRLPAVQA